MNQVYNLHRFGADEFAVGQLINGDFPDNDMERARILEAPEYHIHRMLSEHHRAQAAVEARVQAARPFVLYLRSFSAEFAGTRKGQDVIGTVSFPAIKFQERLSGYLETMATPLVRLHGGSDGFYPGEGDVCVLSTHTGNWRNVARELIQQAGAIVILLSDLNPGVLAEIKWISAFSRRDHCLIAIPPETSTLGDDELFRKMFGGGAGPQTPRNEIRRHVADFPYVWELAEGNGASALPCGFFDRLSEVLAAADPPTDASETRAARFTYLERSFVETDFYDQTQQRIWRLIRELRVLTDETYWATLDRYGISASSLNFDQAWTSAHESYGLAIAACDFRAIDESLDHLLRLHLWRGADQTIPALQLRYRKLAEEMFAESLPDMETAFTNGLDLMSFPVKSKTVRTLQKLARSQTDTRLANLLHFASSIYALKCSSAPVEASISDQTEARFLAAQIACDWASVQFDMGLGDWGILNHRLSVEIFRALASEDPDRFRQDLSYALMQLGSRSLETGDTVRAEVSYREALEIRKSIGPTSAAATVALYKAHANLGFLLDSVGRYAEAIAFFDDAIVLCRDHAEADQSAMTDLVQMMAWQASALAQMPGRADDAKAAADQAISVLAGAPVDAGLRASLAASIDLALTKLAEQQS